MNGFLARLATFARVCCKTRTARLSLSLFLLLMMSVSVRSVRASPQDPKESQSDWVTIRGDSDPAGIPSFLAWSSFFGSLDSLEISGGLEHFLRSTLGFDQSSESQESLERIYDVIVEQIIGRARDEQKLEHQRKIIIEARNEGSITSEEFGPIYWQLVDEDLDSLVRHCRQLRSALEVSGDSRVWEALRSYVETKHKSQMSIRTNFEPDDIKYLQVISQFDSMLEQTP